MEHYDEQCEMNKGKLSVWKLSTRIKVWKPPSGSSVTDETSRGSSPANPGSSRPVRTGSFPPKNVILKVRPGAWEIPIFVIWQVWAFCDSHLPTIHTHSQLCKPNEKDKLSLFAKDFTVSIFLGIAKNPMLPYCKQESLLSITSAPWMRNAPSGPAVWWKMNFEQIAKIFLLAYFFGVGESALIFAWCFWWHFQPGPKLIQWGLKPNLTILADVHLLMFPQSATLSWGVIKCVCVHVCSWCHCLCWRWSRAMVLLMLSVRTSELSLSKKWLWQRA